VNYSLNRCIVRSKGQSFSERRVGENLRSARVGSSLARTASMVSELPGEGALWTTPIEVFDPHFHIWDIRESVGHADPATLFAPAGTEHEGLYDATDLERDWAPLPAPFVHMGVPRPPHTHSNACSLMHRVEPSSSAQTLPSGRCQQVACTSRPSAAASRACRRSSSRRCA